MNNFIPNVEAELDQQRAAKADAHERGDKKGEDKAEARIVVLERTLLQAKRVGISAETGGFTRPEKYQEKRKCK